MKLTLFDLDHTLLHGDSDQLWCEFLMDRGVLPRAEFEARNRAMAHDYALGQASAEAFCNFYIGTLAGRSAADWRRAARRLPRHVHQAPHPGRGACAGGQPPRRR